MAEAEIESLLDKKYAEIENDFAALLGSAILQPQQVYVLNLTVHATQLGLGPLDWPTQARSDSYVPREAIKVTFDLTSEKEIARVLEQRGGANPDAVAAARKRTNTKLVRSPRPSLDCAAHPVPRRPVSSRCTTNPPLPRRSRRCQTAS